jgi:hypothetical protein
VTQRVRNETRNLNDLAGDDKRAEQRRFCRIPRVVVMGNIPVPQ